MLHTQSRQIGSRLNWLLGANDGIVSTAGMVVGVAGAAATAVLRSSGPWGAPTAGEILAMAATHGIGTLVGTQG